MTIRPYDAAEGRDTEVVDLLREGILAGTYSADLPLRIDALALRFGVSHMPVREALRRLESEGLVTLTPHRGARVVEVTATVVAELFDVRMLVEAFMTRRAAERMTAEVLATLETIENRYEIAAARGNVADALRANRDFHRTINAAAGNHDGVLILDRHWRLIGALWRVHGYETDRFAGVIADHRQMLTAFAARDVDGAGALSAAHSTRAKQALLQRMERGAAARRSAAA
jgi:DNA-binding GntR family transcriptional regulator